MQKHIDPMSATRDLRLKTGFPENASRWMRFVHFLALPAQLLTRHYLGVRVVGLGRLAGMLLLLSMIANSGAGIEFDDRGDQWEAFGGNFGVALVLFGMGIFYRFRRAAMRRRGERVVSLSMGISSFAKLMKADTTERYFDGIYVVLLGAFLDIFEIFPGSDIIGDWLSISGLCLLGVEKYVHNIRMKQYDGLLNAEGHEMAAAASLQTQNSKPPVAPATPVSTGLDPDLAERICARGNQTLRNRDEAAQRGLTTKRTPTAAAAIAACITQRGAAQIALGATIAAALMLAQGRAHAGVISGLAPATAAASQEDSGPAKARQLGNDFYFGENGKPRDLPAAAHMYQLASAAGDLPAMVNLAHMTRWGEGGITKDPHKAFLLYERAALKGSLLGATYYADMLADGEGGVKDEPRAVRYYQLAAPTVPRAQLGLAYLYRDGRGGLKQSDARYFDLCQQAANGGFDLAQMLVGTHLLFGERGAPKDPAAAAVWLQRAVDQDLAVAKTLLGRLYASGIGVSQDDEAAARLLTEAAYSGDADGKYYLALLVLEGRGGLAQDVDVVVSLIVQAANGGCDEAAEKLEALKGMARKGDAKMAERLSRNGIAMQ